MNQQSKFVIFNCSEYADNPQLLLSHLFGHVKGAFTGADTEKGLVEEAEDGVLLLMRYTGSDRKDRKCCSC